jgi:murein DD-endopeptidase MepM/ murein hydrolase activator NlpD
MSIADFFNRFGDSAKKAGQLAGVDPSFVFAQWAHESGYGTNTGAKYNNLAGILAYKGSPYGTSGKKYSNINDFITDYVNVIKNPRYDLSGIKNVTDFANALRAGGYAEDSSYSSSPTWIEASNYYKKQSSTEYILPVVGKITSFFGKRDAPTQGASTNHMGIDISAPKGTPVKSLFGGTVLETGYSSSYGNFVLTENERFAHLDTLNVEKGQKIDKNYIIGGVGSTGISTGNHLHYEVFKKGERVNPLDYIGTSGIEGNVMNASIQSTGEKMIIEKLWDGVKGYSDEFGKGLFYTTIVLGVIIILIIFKLWR